MNNIDILKTAVERANKNGFELKSDSIHWGHVLDGSNYYSIIFRKDFAQAFWGKELVRPRVKPQAESYKFRLEEMVVSENPLQYIERFLKDDKSAKDENA